MNNEIEIEGLRNANAGALTDRKVTKPPSDEIIDRLNHAVSRLGGVVERAHHFNEVMFGDEPQATVVDENVKEPCGSSVFHERLCLCIDRLNGNLDLIECEARRSSKFIGEA